VSKPCSVPFFLLLLSLLVVFPTVDGVPNIVLLALYGIAIVAGAVSGYAGGEKATAHYEMTSSGQTGHAESVQITYDPRKISYGRILQVYFSVAHDPTELNRQGPDSGTQYRSAIFPQNEEQAKVAKAYIAQLDSAHAFKEPIVTTIEPGRTFYPAEDYHQNYAALNPTQPYIAGIAAPKVAKLLENFSDRLK
jgi:peptide-methionine (S)-S-oxide reductase